MELKCCELTSCSAACYCGIEQEGMVVYCVYWCTVYYWTVYSAFAADAGLTTTVRYSVVKIPTSVLETLLNLTVQQTSGKYHLHCSFSPKRSPGTTKGCFSFFSFVFSHILTFTHFFSVLKPKGSSLSKGGVLKVYGVFVYVLVFTSTKRFVDGDICFSFMPIRNITGIIFTSIRCK